MFKCQRKIHVATQTMSKFGFFWNDKKSRFSLMIEQRLRNTSSKPIMIEEESRSWMELSSLNEVRLIVLMQETNNLHEINNFFMNKLLEVNRELREAHEKSLNEMEELRRFQGCTFDGFSRTKLIEDRDTILELTAKIQELQNEVNCMNDSRVFKDAESVRSGQYHDTSQPAFFPPFRDPGGMLSRSVEMLSRNDEPPDIWDTHGFSGNVFVNPLASSSSPYPEGFNPWISNVTEHTSPHVTSERQTPDTTLWSFRPIGCAQNFGKRAVVKSRKGSPFTRK